VAGTVELFEAELDQPSRLTALLPVAEVSEWPPSGSDYDRDAVELFRAQLVADPSLEGWNSYYVCLGDALVGTGGYFGPPVHGVAEIGYAVCQRWRGRGIATEVVGGLVGAAFASGLERLIAHTEPGNAASIKVLTRNQFKQQEPDQDDRLLFVRTLSDPTDSPPSLGGTPVA
jgi:RimJ/RimL family protein N-acetyltransferase